MRKCKNADKYTGYREPTCNGGDPCEECAAIWRAAQEVRKRRERETNKQASCV